jgi:colicin import membrane protein
MLIKKNDELKKLKRNDRLNNLRIQLVTREIDALQNLFENYNLGMSYFRRARGGRAGLRE